MLLTVSPIKEAQEGNRWPSHQAQTCTGTVTAWHVNMNAGGPQFGVTAMQACALPLTYLPENLDSIEWQNIHKSKTITRIVEFTIEDRKKKDKPPPKPSNRKKVQVADAHDQEGGRAVAPQAVDEQPPTVHVESRSVLACKDASYGRTNNGLILFPCTATARTFGMRRELLVGNGGVALPNMAFAEKCSGEALLGPQSKKPFLVIVVCAVDAEGKAVRGIRPAVSTPFRVATVRTRGKLDIPIRDCNVRLLSLSGPRTRRTCEQACCACVLPLSTLVVALPDLLHASC